MKKEMDRIMNESDEIFFPFSLEELDEGIKALKTGKASGLDGITAEMIKHFGRNARQ